MVLLSGTELDEYVLECVVVGGVVVWVVGVVVGSCVGEEARELEALVITVVVGGVVV